MGQVNRIPNGFLDLLGVESLGKNPPAFGDVLTPTVDLTDLYGAQTLSAHSVVVTLAGTDTQTVVFVPEGETWLLRSVSWLNQSAPGSSGIREGWIFMLDNLPRPETPAGATVEPIIAQMDDTTVGTSDKMGKAVTLGTPIVCIAGVALKARLIRQTGAARNTEVTWLFNRFNA